jgi:hypothetical protein
MTKQQHLWKEYISERDNTAGLVLADYLEENDIDLPLAKGLRFCIKHNKFPRIEQSEFFLSQVSNYAIVYYYWDRSKSTVCKNKKIDSILPEMFHFVELRRYKNIKNAFRSVGQYIIAFHKLTKDII